MHVSAEDNRLYAGPAVDQTPKRGSGKKRKLPANENVVASSPKKKAHENCSCLLPVGQYLAA